MKKESAIPGKGHTSIYARGRWLPLLLALVLFERAGTGQSTLSLHEAIARAESSPQARQGQDRIDAAQGLVRQAGLRPNPRLYLQSEDLRPGASNFDFPNDTEDYAYLGQVFELGGKRAGRLGVAHAGLRQAEAERTLLLQQIAARVAAAYWSAVASERTAQLLENDMAAVDQILTYNQARVDAGAMRGIDLLRTQIERDRLELALQAARREAALTRIELFRQMGQPNPAPAPANPAQGSGNPAPAPASPALTGQLDSIETIDPQSLPTILAARPDILVAREALAAAEADLKLQHSLASPDIDLLAGYKRDTGLNTAYSNLQIPLPFLNRNQGEVERARANLALAHDQLSQLELTVAADVTAAEQAYTRQQEVVLHLLPDMRARARQNLTIMDDAYRSGGVDLLRYLDAERTAFDVEVTALRTLSDYHQAALRLQLAYGVRP